MQLRANMAVRNVLARSWNQTDHVLKTKSQTLSSVMNANPAIRGIYVKIVLWDTTGTSRMDFVDLAIVVDTETVASNSNVIQLEAAVTSARTGGRESTVNIALMDITWRRSMVLRAVCVAIAMVMSTREPTLFVIWRVVYACNVFIMQQELSVKSVQMDMKEMLSLPKTAP